MGGIKWKGIYNSDTRKFLGFYNFMKRHNVHKMYTLLLDYVGVLIFLY